MEVDASGATPMTNQSLFSFGPINGQANKAQQNELKDAEEVVGEGAEDEEGDLVQNTSKTITLDEIMGED